METLEALRKRIATTTDLGSLVHTMRTLSAVSIRQYEQAIIALDEYTRATELVLQAAAEPLQVPPAPEAPGGATLAIVIGSDHGLCGRFNREVATYARRQLEARVAVDRTVHFLAMGERAATALEEAGEKVESRIVLPGSADGLSEAANQLLLDIDRYRAERMVERVLVFHNRRLPGDLAVPHHVQLLPLDRRWLDELRGRKWPTRVLPTFTMRPEALFGAALRQHLFAGLFRAAAQSAASEHAARLSAMQSADHNIAERSAALAAVYRRRRQTSITEELLDVVAGFEALTSPSSSGGGSGISRGVPGTSSGPGSGTS